MQAHPALAPAYGTGRGDPQESLRMHHLSSSPALPANLGGCPRGSARPVARRARGTTGQLYLLRHAGGGLEQRDAQVRLDIGASSLTATPATTPAPAEHVAEDVAKRAEDIPEIAEPRVESATSRFQARVTEAVITRSLLGVRQHLVRLGGLLELGLGLVIVRVAIGMVLHRQAPISCLQLSGVGLPSDAQHVVIVTLFCHG